MVTILSWVQNKTSNHLLGKKSIHFYDFLGLGVSNQFTINFLDSADPNRKRCQPVDIELQWVMFRTYFLLIIFMHGINKDE